MAVTAFRVTRRPGGWWRCSRPVMRCFVYFRHFSKYVVSRIRVIETCRRDELALRAALTGTPLLANHVASRPAETRAESIISGDSSDQGTISDQDVLTSEAGHDVAIHAKIYLVKSSPASPSGFLR